MQIPFELHYVYPIPEFIWRSKLWWMCTLFLLFLFIILYGNVALFSVNLFAWISSIRKQYLCNTTNSQPPNFSLKKQQQGGVGRHSSGGRALTCKVWIIRSSLHGGCICSLGYFPFQPVVQNWTIKCIAVLSVYRKVHMRDPLLLIRKRSLSEDSTFYLKKCHNDVQ